MTNKPQFVGERGIAALKDTCTLIMGQSPSSDSYNTDGKGLPFYQGNADFGEENPLPRFWCTDPKKTAEKGDVLISVRAPIGAVNIANEKCCIGRGVAAIRPNSDVMVAGFLRHQLSASRRKLEAMGTGSTFKAVGKKALGDFSVAIYPKIAQETIECQLDWVVKQIETAGIQLDQLDSLVKSRFVEMFEGSDGYDSNVCRLVDIGEIASGITKGRKVRDKTLIEVPYLSTTNVQAGRLDLSIIKAIEATLPEIERYRLVEGDVLMTEGGDPDKVGRGAIARNLPENCIHQNHVFRVRLNTEILYPEYFEMFLQSPGCREYFFRASKQTTGIATINKTQLSNMQVLVPPIKAQKEFLSFVTQVDKSRFIAQQQIEKLQMLYDSLAQEYFGD